MNFVMRYANGSPAADNAHRAAPAVRRFALVWSEHCYLLCIVLALTLALWPPEWPVPGRRFLRQVPLLATMPIAVLCVVGGALSRAPSDKEKFTPLAVWAPLLLLGGWITVGSVHARLVEHSQATFLNLGLAVFAAPAATYVMIYSRAPEQLAKAYFRLIAVAGAIIAAGLALNFGHRDIYHEQIFLAIPLAVAGALALPRTLTSRLCAILFLGIALLSQKNTSYLIALLSLSYVAALLWSDGVGRAPSIRRIWMHYLAFIGALTVTIAIGFLVYFRETYLPTGNVQFRAFTYRAAWQQFLNSPMWGTGFSAESIREFTLYTVGVARNRLPTHSDAMDLLANGGLLAAALWLVGYARVGVYAYRRVLAPRYLQYPWSGQAHTFAAISLAAMVTYAFNPILLQPELAYLVWTTLGMLVGLAASFDPERRAADIADRAHAVRRGTPVQPLHRRTS